MFNIDSTLPSIGASGAVAAVLGAYLVSYPFARVVTIIPLLFVWPIIDLPALAVLGFWILVQLINGLMTDPATQITGGVAWWAHIGGFLTGMILVGLFAKPIVRRYTWED
jgi:membrane associated rhomboid family serine protease